MDALTRRDVLEWAMAESVPVRCPACRREHLYAAQFYPCVCGTPVAPFLDALTEPSVVTLRAWDDEWATVRCDTCARETQWPHPELGCDCGTMLRIPVRADGAPPRTGGPAEADPDRPADGADTPPDGDASTFPADDRGQADDVSGLPEPGRPVDRASTSLPAADHAGGGAAERGTQGEIQDADTGTTGGAGQGSGREAGAGAGPGASGEDQGSGTGAEAGPSPDPGSGTTVDGGPDGRLPGPRDAARPGGTRDGGAGGRVPFRPVTIRTARDAVTAAALYLRWLGHPDVRRADQRPPSGIGLAARGILAQVDPTVRPASLRDVECLWLTAMTESATCVYFSLAGYAEDALAGADALGVPLFVLDLTGTPQPVNSPADDLVAFAG